MNDIFENEYFGYNIYWKDLTAEMQSNIIESAKDEEQEIPKEVLTNVIPVANAFNGVK